MKMVLVRALAMAGATASVFCGVPAVAQKAASTGQNAGPAAMATRTAALPPYRVNPGDEIEVYVWGEERLQRSMRVLPDGTFSFPLAGRIEAAGKLPSELEAAISRGLASQFRDQVPQVTVSIRTPSGFQVSVIGKVRSPGTLTPGRYVNVLEALFLAGGPTEFANTNDIVILRKQGAGLTPIKVRLSDAIKGNPSARDLAGLLELQSGDTVVVP
ncbi:polysaccharide biosynthesis/export family protein [Sphingomonas sp. 1P08PE]|uniref:polysaccharide biosynthesis/export family protein n=1 Tax=Sphingomonas sp. 1P08PE TaxID=554122 RepID=UPI0039A07507